jgi:hypothetical protein
MVHVVHRSFAGRDLIAYNLPMEGDPRRVRADDSAWVEEVSRPPLLPNANAGAMYPVRSSRPCRSVRHDSSRSSTGPAGLGTLTRRRSASARGRLIAGVTCAFSGVVVSDVFFRTSSRGAAAVVIWVLAGRAPLVHAGVPTVASVRA